MEYGAGLHCWPKPLQLRKVAEISALKATLAQTEAEGRETGSKTDFPARPSILQEIQSTPFSQRNPAELSSMVSTLPAVGEETLRLRGSGPELTAAELLATEAERLEEAGPKGNFDMLGALEIGHIIIY